MSDRRKNDLPRPATHPRDTLHALRPRPKVDVARLEELGRELLVALGEDPAEPRIADTPRRWARWWQAFVQHDPGKVDTTFETVHADQMVVVSGIKVWSLCEHHLLPFWCEVAIGYIPQRRVLGLSKFGRIAHHAASQLQIQERLVNDIAGAVKHIAQCADVAVIARGEHLCMTMRGVRTPALMTSSAVDGRFRDPDARAEFLSLATTALSR
jgi:GTP cyclohydrolase I